jgi:NO-binding membrane sensor protein with MHYT domain
MDPLLVAVSVAIAVLSSMMALQMAVMARRSQHARRTTALSTGALAMGAASGHAFRRHAGLSALCPE